MRAMNQNRKTVVQEIPTRTQLEEELNRERYQSRFFVLCAVQFMA